MTFGEQSTEKESHDMLSYSFDQGINILDTAEIVSTQSFYSTIVSSSDVNPSFI
jgi:aryl-alcohol dehydrogenase-like predicted oxidoreductase